MGQLRKTPITYDLVFQGCLVASIAHALMTNVYPNFESEQSWDGMNYSIQNFEGMRGTITFSDNFCVGAIRNDAVRPIDPFAEIKGDLTIPSEVWDLAVEETFQYLLLESNGLVTSQITSMFWVDNRNIYAPRFLTQNFMSDIVLLDRIFLPMEEAIEKWGEYYNMDSTVVSLLVALVQRKLERFDENIHLSKKQLCCIPGDGIHRACEESLNEIGIYLA